MAFNHRPDLTVPDSQFRCEAMAKGADPNQSWQQWIREPHRCVKRAVQSRGTHIVCAVHAKQKADVIQYWDGHTPDAFVKKVGFRRYRVPAGVGASW